MRDQEYFFSCTLLNSLFVMASKFQAWQNSRRQISFDEFAKKYPNPAKFIASDDFCDIGKIFVYRDGTWIVERSYGERRPHFLAFIQYEWYYSSEDMEIVEMRQYLYQYDRDE